MLFCRRPKLLLICTSRCRRRTQLLLLLDEICGMGKVFVVYVIIATVIIKTTRGGEHELMIQFHLWPGATAAKCTTPIVGSSTRNPAQLNGR